MRVVGYARVSTDDQSSGLATQVADLQRWAASQPGVELLAVHTDEDKSGALELDKRPGLLAALAQLKRGAVLVATKRDRLARDPMVAAALASAVKRKGARIYTLDGASGGDGPTGELLEGMVDLIARFERRLIGQRVAAGMRRKRELRSFLGTAPFGWSRGEEVPDAGTAGTRITLVQCPEEQETIRRIVELRGGGADLREIVKTLEAENRPPRGRRWHLTTVARLVAVHAGQPVCTGGPADDP